MDNRIIRGWAGKQPHGRMTSWRRNIGIAPVLAGIAVLAVACGSPASSGGGSAQGGGAQGSTTSNGSTYAKEVAYAKCMRQHGIPNFPDPNSNGGFVMNGIDPNSPQMQSAQQACRSYAPPPQSQGQQSQLLAAGLKFAHCMRAHGISNFPDPSKQANGGTQVQIGSSSGIDPKSPQFQSAQQACQSLLPGAIKPGVPGAGAGAAG